MHRKVKTQNNEETPIDVYIGLTSQMSTTPLTSFDQPAHQHHLKSEIDRFMTQKPLRVVTKDGLVDLSFADLSPNISNARLIVQVLKASPISYAKQGVQHHGTLLVVRDNQFTAVVCCWSMATVVKANAFKTGDIVEIQYPDIRFRKNYVGWFPATFEYELHLEDMEKGTSETYSVKPNIFALKTASLRFQLPPTTLFSQLQEVCVEECVNMVVTVGSIIEHIGEAKNTQKSLHRTYRLWNPHNPQGYTNLTVWGHDIDCFHSAAVGDMLVAERVKVIRYKNFLQLTNTPHSLYYFNEQLPLCETLRAEWLDKVKKEREKANLHSATIPSSGENLQPNTQAQARLVCGTPKDPAKKNKKKPEVRSEPITKYFKRAPSPQRAMPSTPTATAEPSQPLISPFSLMPAPKRVCRQEEQKEHFLVAGRFSVADALQLRDLEACWIVACLYDIQAKSTRGYCLFNCMNCRRSKVECRCSLACQAFAWSFDVRVAWKDQENQLLTDLTDAQAQRLLKCDAFQYAVCEADERDAIMQNAKEPLYKLYFEKTAGVLTLKAMIELPQPVEE